MGLTATIKQLLRVQKTLAFAKARGALFGVALAVAIRVRTGPGAFHYHAAPFLREACRCGLAEAAVLRKIFAAIRRGRVASVARVACTVQEAFAVLEARGALARTKVAGLVRILQLPIFAFPFTVAHCVTRVVGEARGCCLANMAWVLMDFALRPCQRRGWRLG